jgi:predicted RNA binding protein YcfA (HicA-like mRNA interferase family)
LVKLRLLSGKEVCAILRKAGFEEVRRRGSHIVMQKKIPQGTITVPVPDHNEIRIGTLQSIIRQSGLSRVSLSLIESEGQLTS